jgi:hypothetical protein
MKKLVQLTSLLLILLLTLTAMGCSSYGKLEKAFLDNGYEIITELEEEAEDIKAELEKEELEVTVHGLTKKDGFKSDIVLILEFKATDDLVQACKENNTLNGLVKDVQEDEDVQAFYDKLVEKGYAKGNCLVVSFNPLSDASTIVKNA